MEITYSNCKCIEELRTYSRPLLIEDIKLDTYVCKTIAKTNKISILFVEFLAYHYFKILDYPIPEMKIMIVENSHLKGSSYFREGGTERKFLASKKLTDSIEIDTMPKDYRHYQYKKYNFFSLIKIVFFDYVFYNIDRKPENPNILLDNNQFYAIDNAQCFNYSSGLIDIKEIPDLKQDCLTTQESLLFHPLIKKIIKNNSKNIELVRKLVCQEFCNKTNDLLRILDYCSKLFELHFGAGVDYNWYEDCLKQRYLNDKWIEFNIELFLQDLRSCL